MPQVVLYGTSFCPFCVAARRLLRTKGINFEDIPLDKDHTLRAKVMARSGRNTVPQIWIGDAHIGGFTDLQELEAQGQLNKFIDSIDQQGVELPESNTI